MRDIRGLTGGYRGRTENRRGVRDVSRLGGRMKGETQG